jgi:hypothetical protein
MRLSISVSWIAQNNRGANEKSVDNGLASAQCLRTIHIYIIPKERKNKKKYKDVTREGRGRGTRHVGAFQSINTSAPTFPSFFLFFFLSFFHSLSLSLSLSFFFLLIFILRNRLLLRLLRRRRLLLRLLLILPPPPPPPPPPFIHPIFPFNSHRQKRIKCNKTMSLGLFNELKCCIPN